MNAAMHPAAAEHQPIFITPPGQTDVLMVLVGLFLLGVVLAVGLLYLRLHALPEHVSHRANRVQFEIVAVLSLLALFTHNHIFWIIALLLAMVQIPDFSSPLQSIAESLRRIARGEDRRPETTDASAPASADGPRQEG